MGNLETLIRVENRGASEGVSTNEGCDRFVTSHPV